MGAYSSDSTSSDGNGIAGAERCGDVAGDLLLLGMESSSKLSVAGGAYAAVWSTGTTGLTAVAAIGDGTSLTIVAAMGDGTTFTVFAGFGDFFSMTSLMTTTRPRL